MKKILFGSVSAILGVFGLSAFKTAKSVTTNPYWLSVISNVPSSNTTIPVNDKVNLITVNGGVYAGGAATFLTASASTIVSHLSSNPCNSGADFCLVGFGSAPLSDVTSSKFTKVIVTIGIIVDAAAGSRAAH